MSAWLIANIAPLMFITLVITLLIGFPVAFSLAAVGIFWAIVGIELNLLQPTLIQALPDRVWGVPAWHLVRPRARFRHSH